MYPRAILKVCRSGSLSHPLLCLPFVESNPGLGDSALLDTAAKLSVDRHVALAGLALLMLLRILCPQAFRQLSHRFHGKGSGKMKTERRMKKLDEEAVGLRRGVGVLHFWVLCDKLSLLPLF